ncbi:hypothetical protein [Haloarcula laminariae]|uniref:hypothetical protein n=1 Tax=Haloarcula laminariae TaxID=2961577 RepID=UPI0021CAC6D9|nr:hypothetical protein [Halomicroarcula laminariae]
MNRRSLLAVALASVGLGAIVAGSYQELLHVAPAYEGTIETGWGGPRNHQERLLTRVGVLGLLGAVVASRWRYAALASVATGAVVLFYPVRAVLRYALDPGLYTEVTTYSGDTVEYVLGAEPFLLAAGGLLLVAAGVIGWRTHAAGTDAAASTRDPSFRA